MRHHSKRAVFHSCMKAKEKPCNTGISAACHSSVCTNKKTEQHCRVPEKTKRLKTIKQRNLIRGQSSSTSNQIHQCCEKGSKDKGPCSKCQVCRCSRSLNLSRKENPVANPLPLHKPSIITQGRLTSIRGLFNHEVRSIDIERLVKEKKNTKHLKKQEGPAISSNSPLVPNVTPPAMIFETSEEGISACANKEQKMKKTGKEQKADCLQTSSEGTVPITMCSGDEKHSSVQTPKAVQNTPKPEGQPNQNRIQEAKILSSSESEPVHKAISTSLKVTPSDHYVSPLKRNTHKEKHTSMVTTAVGVEHDFLNVDRLDTLGGSKVLNSHVVGFDSSSTIFISSSPRLNRNKILFEHENQHRKPGVLSKEEVTNRLAARLCHNLGSFPAQRCCPLLLECRKVLLGYVKERHGCELQHSLHRLHSDLKGERSNSPYHAQHIQQSSGQKYLDDTQIYFSYTKKQEDKQQSKTREFQTDKVSQKHGLQEFVCENVETGVASKRQRKQTWRIHSPQDLLTKLQWPSQDMLSQGSITARSQESVRAKQRSSSKPFSLPWAITAPQSPVTWTYNCSDKILHPFDLEPQKQIKLGTGENRRRPSTILPLLEQWKNDPDLSFLFQDENSKETQTPLDPMTELRICSPHNSIKGVNERKRFGGFSTVSALFPPEEFCYEPYYRFPHPSNSFNRPENSGVTLNKQSSCMFTGGFLGYHCN